MTCGSELAAAAPADAPAPAGTAAEAPPEERRTATVLFADLSGYTAAAERMDPEAVKALVDRTLRRLGEEIERFGGSIDKFIGDNVMGVFGAPVAHEDDPERAVRAGLAMQAAMDGVNREIDERHGVSFSLRVGINSGEVMAGAVGDRYTVMGDVVNVAARLQAAGRPGSVTVGEETHRATREVGLLRAPRSAGAEGQGGAGAGLGGEGDDRRAGARRARRSETKLIGRAEEAELLVSLVERVEREQRPYLVTVIGQAGVGKSRLMRELIETHRLLQGRRRPSAAASARPTPVSHTWRWSRSSASSSTCSTPTRQRPPGGRFSSGVGALMEELGEPESAERNAALLAVPLGIEPPEQSAFTDDDPQRDARSAVLGGARGDRGDHPPPDPGAGDRRHPLGRRGHARPDRPPGALGARAAAAGLPGARRAAREPARAGAAGARTRPRSRWSR